MTDTWIYPVVARDWSRRWKPWVAAAARRLSTGTIALPASAPGPTRRPSQSYHFTEAAAERQARRLAKLLRWEYGLKEPRRAVPLSWRPVADCDPLLARALTDTELKDAGVLADDWVG